MNSLLRSALLAAATTVATVGASVGFSTPAAACSPDSYVGTVCTFAFAFCPRGWVAADGRELAINQNQALYALTGITYGGNGATTFAVPDLRGRTTIGTGQGPGLPLYNLAQKIGAPQHATLVPLPAHSHTAIFVPASGSMASGTVDIPITGTVSGQSVSGNASLPVTGTANVTLSNDTQAKIASDGNITNNLLRTNTPNANATLVQAQVGGASVYSASGSGIAPNTVIGPPGSVTGTATGPISGTAAGPLSGATISGGAVTGNAKGTATLAFTSGSGSGTVSIQESGIISASMTIPTQSPSLAITTCIAVEGVFPPRP